MFSWMLFAELKSMVNMVLSNVTCPVIGLTLNYPFVKFVILFFNAYYK